MRKVRIAIVLEISAEVPSDAESVVAELLDIGAIQDLIENHSFDACDLKVTHATSSAAQIKRVAS